MRLTCEQIIAFLDSYLDGQLDAETLAAFEYHLARCTSCVAYLATYREIIRIARAAKTAPMLNVEDVPEDLVRAVMAAVASPAS
jgi:anti-sigma factor RsiW